MNDDPTNHSAPMLATAVTAWVFVLALLLLITTSPPGAVMTVFVFLTAAAAIVGLYAFPVGVYRFARNVDRIANKES